MIMQKYIQIKEQFSQSKDWIMKHPKLVYTYVMVVLIISFGLIFLQYFYITPKISISNSIPNLYTGSDKIKSDMEENERKMDTVVKELQQLKKKRESGPLTKNDSIRIEYLFNQYQALKNGD